MDTDYKPTEMEERTLFGLRMQQKRNDAIITPDLFDNVVTKSSLNDDALRDLTVASIALKVCSTFVCIYLLA